MVNRLRLFSIALLGLSLVACGWWRNVPVDNHPASIIETWFCIANITRDGWDCSQDPQLADVPLPARPAPSRETTSATPHDAGAETVRPTVKVAIEPDPGTMAPEHDADDADVARAGMPPGPTTQAAVALAKAGTRTIAEIPADYYAVQLVAMSTRAGAERFMAEHGLEDAIITPVESGGRIMHALIYGIYPDRAAARAAVQSRPASLLHIRPWVRRFDSLRAAAARAGG